MSSPRAKNEVEPRNKLGSQEIFRQNPVCYPVTLKRIRMSPPSPNKSSFSKMISPGQNELSHANEPSQAKKRGHTQDRTGVTGNLQSESCMLTTTPYNRPFAVAAAWRHMTDPPAVNIGWTSCIHHQLSSRSFPRIVML